MAKKGVIEVGAIVPGGFYQGVFPGGFTDAVTGIHVPGPVVNLDKETKRQVVSISSMPDPVQVPHFKRIIDFKDKDRKVREEVEVTFDRQDEQPLHEGLVLALNTGNIRYVSEEEMADRYPQAWEEREERKVFDKAGKPARPMLELIEEFHVAAEKSNQRAEEANDAHIAGTNALDKPLTPPKPRR